MMTSGFLHLVAIASGLAAALVFFAVLYLAGNALIPRRWHATLGAGTPAVVGAAAYALVCWYGIKGDVRLTPLVLGFAGAGLVLSALRGRHTLHALRRLVMPAGRHWSALFVALYVLAYAFTCPPVTDALLPIAWRGNTDLLHYLVFSRHLEQLGPPMVADVSAHHYVYFQTPAAFSLLGGFSTLFGRDPMAAAMPAQFALVALVGVLAAAISRRVFCCSRLAASLVGAVMVSGPFFRLIVGDYYLSTLLAMPLFLHLLMTTVGRGNGQGSILSRGFGFLAHYTALFFIYPFLLATALGFQLLAVALGTVAALRLRPAAGLRAEVTRRLGEAGKTVAGMTAAGLALAALAPLQLMWVLQMMRDLSRPGVAGAPKDVISPLALLGVPSAMHTLGEPAGSMGGWLVAGLWLLGVLPMLMLSGRLGGRLTREQRVFLGLAGAGFLAYAAYFCLVGPSYQQWKFASYTVMPLAFLGTTVVLRLVQGWGSGHPRGWGSAVAPALAVLLGAGLSGGNLVVHAMADRPLETFPGDLRRLSAITRLPAFRDLALKAPNPRSVLLAAYFVRNKRLHVSSPHFAPFEPVAFERISPAQPLLMMDYYCDGVGHSDTMSIDGVGCLLFQPPTLLADTGYPFSRSYLFIAADGLSIREEWGRWNGRRRVELTLTADQRRIRLDADAAYLNLLLQPCLLPSVRGQRIILSWGAGHRGTALLGEERWVSLPMRSSDWTGEWVAKQVVSLDLPDALPPHWVDGRQETRPLAVGFRELSVSATPRGSIVTPLP